MGFAAAVGGAPPAYGQPRPIEVPTETSSPARRVPAVPARRFEWFDWLGTAAALGGYYAVDLGLPPLRESSWEGPLPGIDEPVRGVLVLDSRRARERAEWVGNRLSYASVSYPVLLTALAPVRAERGFDALLQLNLMNLQAYSVSSLLARLSHKLVGRTRPAARGCEEDPDYDRLCGSRAQYASFFGGHAATTMTGAGLACAHHLHARLLGGGLADAVGCGAALVVAGGVFLTRLQADRHWLSDNLVGAAVGLASGYGLPTWLYYEPVWRRDESPPTGRRSSAPGASWAVLPALGSHSVGVQWLGALW